MALLVVVVVAVVVVAVAVAAMVVAAVVGLRCKKKPACWGGFGRGASGAGTGAELRDRYLYRNAVFQKAGRTREKPDGKQNPVERRSMSVTC